MHKLKNSKLLVTGGAGFIGSNLIEYFLANDNEVVCLDDLSTGHRKNIVGFLDNPNFQMLEGDIRDLDTCKTAVRDCEYIFHQAALGSVPRSIKDPVTTNAVNIDGFLNMLTAARDEGVKRFIYAASSSTYGDSKELPKMEERIGRPLSPYAITKVVNEYFAKVYSEIYGLETIGLRYFNVFGRRQDPNGAYAAVIPLWVKRLIEHQSPVINGDGSYSRDFTYIDNVIQANELAATTPRHEILESLDKYYVQLKKAEKLDIDPPTTIMDIFNVASGGRTTLLELFETLRCHLSQYDPEIAQVEVTIGPKRQGDIPHSLASVDKAKLVLGYDPQYDASQGFEVACAWYYENLK
ncbi:MAG: SDR family oxidoreductase [Candidatus Marinimicrobia bacterium]|nr:SDR family oxidoreductase [Candidatus Neomarinimicrobiota bacterium]